MINGLGRGPDLIVIRDQEHPCSASMLLLQVITPSPILICDG
jgi:hypothetical protein